MLNDVIFDIFLTLLNTNKISSIQLAEKYELSTRTIKRYIDVLICANIPIVSKSGINGGYSIANNYKLSNMYLSAEETQLIISGLNNLPLKNDAKLIEKTINKITALNRQVANSSLFLSSEQLFINTQTVTSISNKIDCLATAIKQCKVVSMEYHSISGEQLRQVEPHCLTISDGAWYMYGFCHLRNAFRIFKIARIATIFITEEKFTKREIDLKDRVLRMETQAQAKKINLSLRIKPAARIAVEEWLGIENVFVVGNSILACVDINDDDALISKLLSLSNNVEVAYPITLRTKLKEIAENIAQLYSK